MNISRKLGIMVFMMVPAIIGGALTWWATHGSYPAVGVFVILLYTFAGSMISK
jgi:hypothetical protein